MLFARREKIDHFDYVVVIIEMQDGEQHKLYNVAVFKLYSTESKKYYKYNKRLLFDERQQEILAELDEVEEDLNTALKC